MWSSGADYLIPNRRPHRNGERSAKVIYDTVKKVAARVGVTTHVHALRAAFAVQFDEQNPGRVIALKELLGHARVETHRTRRRERPRGPACSTSSRTFADRSVPQAVSLRAPVTLSARSTSQFFGVIRPITGFRAYERSARNDP